LATYNVEAINECMRKTQDHTSRFGEIADTFPQVCSVSTAYGSLPSSAAVSSAVDELNSMLNEEFTAAETKLDGVARTLDAVVQTVSDTDYSHAAAMTPR
jgi:hypothetical protein